MAKQFKEFFSLVFYFFALKQPSSTLNYFKNCIYINQSEVSLSVNPSTRVIKHYQLSCYRKSVHVKSFKVDALTLCQSVSPSSFALTKANQSISQPGN